MEIFRKKCKIFEKQTVIRLEKVITVSNIKWKLIGDQTIDNLTQARLIMRRWRRRKMQFESEHPELIRVQREPEENTESFKVRMLKTPGNQEAQYTPIARVLINLEKQGNILNVLARRLLHFDSYF